MDKPRKRRLKGEWCKVIDAYAFTPGPTPVRYRMRCHEEFDWDGEEPPETCPGCGRKVKW